MDNDGDNNNTGEHLWSCCYVPITTVIVSHILTHLMLISIWQSSLCTQTQSWKASALNSMTWNFEVQFWRVNWILENGILLAGL